MLAFVFNGNWVSFLYEDPTYHKSIHIKYALQMALKILKIATLMLMTYFNYNIIIVKNLDPNLIILFNI